MVARSARRRPWAPVGARVRARLGAALAAGLLVTVGSSVLAPLPARAQSTIRVPGDFPTIQAAIDGAVSGGSIEVAPGTYGAIDFHGKAVTVESTAGPQLTVIDGGSTSTAVTFTSGETSGAVLRGFTVQHGAPHGGVWQGGGVLIANASPTVDGNIITLNIACGGNGIQVNGGSPAITHNWITDNSSPKCSGSVGGGIAVGGNGPALISGNVIVRNSADSGAGIELNSADPLIRANVIALNHTGGQGGGIGIINVASTTIVDNLIAGNVAGEGAGIYSYAWMGTQGPVIAGNTIAGNTIAANYSGTASGILAGGYAGTLQIADNIVAAAPGKAAVVCDTTHNAGLPSLASNDVVADQTRYGGACTDQTGSARNISADPLFADPSNIDFHLKSGSPAIDAGTSTPAPPANDLDGKPRVVNGTVDLGAYEWSSGAAPVPTTTVLTSSSATAAVGSTVTFAAGELPSPGGAAMLSGSVTYYLDGHAPPQSCGGTLVDGWWPCTVQLTSAGVHTLSVQVGGGGGYQPSSATLSMTVTQGPTTTSLQADHSPVGAGQPVTYTAQVGFSAFQGSHDGTVAFSQDGAVIGGCDSRPLAQGVATCSVTYQSTGAHDVVASFAGNADFTASSSSSLHEAVNAPAVATLTSSVNPSVSGQGITLTASVGAAGQPAAGTPTGSVAFADRGVTLPACVAVPLSGSTATCTLALAAGSHSLTATYSGDNAYGSTTSSALAQSVGQATTSVAIPSSSSDPAASQEQLVLGTTVQVTAPGGGTPTGTVNFNDGSTSLGSSPLDASGHASITTAALSEGTRSITATYSGDGSYSSSTSGPLQLDVLPVEPTQTDIVTSSYPSVPGQRVSLAILVSAPGSAPTGQVTVVVNNSTRVDVTLDSRGVATVELPGLPTGDDTITATYWGDRFHSGSSASFDQKVVAASASRRFVNQLYDDILGRPADDGAAGWATALGRQQITRTQVALALTSSTEYLTNQIEGAYLTHLGRHADTAGLDFWLGYIRRGSTFEDLEVSFLGTPEYFASAGGTPDGFLTALYLDVFGRDVDPGGRAYWVGRLNSGTPAWVVAASVVKSTEAMSNRVRGDYGLLLGRDPDAAGLTYWTSLLQGGTRDETLLGFLAGTDEYWADTQAY